MMCKLKGRMDKGGHSVEKKKSECKRGHYGVQIERAD